MAPERPAPVSIPPGGERSSRTARRRLFGVAAMPPPATLAPGGCRALQVPHRTSRRGAVGTRPEPILEFVKGIPTRVDSLVRQQGGDGVEVIAELLACDPQAMDLGFAAAPPPPGPAKTVDHPLEPSPDVVLPAALHVDVAEGRAQPPDALLPSVGSGQHRQPTQRELGGTARCDERRQEATPAPGAGHAPVPADPGSDDVQIAHPGGDTVEKTQAPPEPPAGTTRQHIAEKAQVDERPAGSHPEVVDPVGISATVLDVGEQRGDRP